MRGSATRDGSRLSFDSFSIRAVVPADPPGLGTEGIHVWHVDIGIPPTGDPAVLSSEEAARAARFRFERDRAAFVARRVWLRHVLASYLKVPPAAIELEASSTGKLELARPAKTGLRFSASRSGRLAVYAVARHQPIGVDVETLEREADLRVAERAFGTEVAAALRALPPLERTRLFLTRWCLMEAAAKATGIGLGMIDRGVDMPSPEAMFPTRIRLEGRPWWIGTIPTAPGFVGALASGGERAGSVLHLTPAPP
jgi:4'-phosphopantetheinyl transferase